MEEGTGGDKDDSVVGGTNELPQQQQQHAGADGGGTTRRNGGDLQLEEAERLHHHECEYDRQAQEHELARRGDDEGEDDQLAPVLDYELEVVLKLKSAFAASLGMLESARDDILEVGLRMDRLRDASRRCREAISSNRGGRDDTAINNDEKISASSSAAAAASSSSTKKKPPPPGRT